MTQNWLLVSHLPGAGLTGPARHRFLEKLRRPRETMLLRYTLFVNQIVGARQLTGEHAHASYGASGPIQACNQARIQPDRSPS
jgi:hypothetical protein